jgi:hypothetical protein
MDFFIGLVVWLNLAGEPVHSEALGFAKGDLNLCKRQVSTIVLSDEYIEQTKRAISVGFVPTVVCVKLPETKELINIPENKAVPKPKSKGPITTI